MVNRLLADLLHGDWMAVILSIAVLCILLFELIEHFTVRHVSLGHGVHHHVISVRTCTQCINQPLLSCDYQALRQ